MNFNNKEIQIASNHLHLAQKEIQNCAKIVYDALEKLEQLYSNDATSIDLITKAMTALQFQDIVHQRLMKVDKFLQTIDPHINIKLQHQFIEEFAWENEVNQEDVDSLFNTQKG